jgi:hypothetical protein
MTEPDLSHLDPTRISGPLLTSLDIETGNKQTIETRGYSNTSSWNNTGVWTGTPSGGADIEIVPQDAYRPDSTTSGG